MIHRFVSKQTQSDQNVLSPEGQGSPDHTQYSIVENAIRPLYKSMAHIVQKRPVEKKDVYLCFSKT